MINECIIIEGGASIKPHLSELQPLLTSKKNKKIRTCPVCLKDSIFPLNAKKYCSKECSLKAIKLIRHKNYLMHRQHNLNLARKYRKLHPDSAKIYNRIHKKRINEQRRLNRKLKKQIIKDKLIKNLRSRVRIALKRNNKSEHTIKLIGCSINFLKKHLESQFKSEMSWSNYGLWHIDHKRPCSLFDLNKPEEQKKCFHYTNLQPLWAEDNLRKGDKYDLS